jgi:serine/threonine protein kinase
MAGKENNSGCLPLAEGSQLVVGPYRLKIVKKIGKGSFGTVWKAMGEDPKTVAPVEIALKELTVSQDMLPQVLQECELLQKFNEACDQRVEHPCLVAYLGHEVQQVDTGQVCVLLAMKMAAGQTFNAWLLQKNRTLTLQNSVVLKQRRPPSAGKAFTHCLESLQKLGATLEVMNTYVGVHRDVTAHNILISRNGESFDYALVDFGLAAPKLEWESLHDPDCWANRDVCGDCRYWPISAWHMFILGPASLMANVNRRHQYIHDLDMYALVYVALEVLIAFLKADGFQKTPEYVCAGDAQIYEAYRGIIRAFSELESVLGGVSLQVCQLYTNADANWEKLRESLQTKDFLSELSGKYSDLLEALCAVSALLLTSSSTFIDNEFRFEHSKILQILANMLDENCIFRWKDFNDQRRMIFEPQSQSSARIIERPPIFQRRFVPVTNQSKRPSCVQDPAGAKSLTPLVRLVSFGGITQQARPRPQPNLRNSRSVLSRTLYPGAF